MLNSVFLQHFLTINVTLILECTTVALMSLQFENHLQTFLIESVLHALCHQKWTPKATFFLVFVFITKGRSTLTKLEILFHLSQSIPLILSQFNF